MKLNQADLYNDQTIFYLKELTRDIFGPKTHFTNDLIANDIFLPAFELNKKEPYFYAKKIVENNKKKYEDKDQYVRDISRAAFEYPGVVLENEKTFVDPHDFVLSASNLAYLYVRHQRNEANSNIRMLNLDPGIMESKTLLDEFEIYQDMTREERLSYRKHNTNQHILKQVLADKTTQEYIIRNLLKDGQYLLVQPADFYQSNPIKLKEMK